MIEDEEWEDEDTADELATELYSLMREHLARFPLSPQEDALDRLTSRLNERG